MLALLLLPLELAVVAVVLVTRQSQKTGAARLRRVRLSLAEGKQLSDARQRMRDRQARVERTVDCSTDTLEAVHLALADLSFDLWGGRDSARVRAAHHKHAGTVYQGIRLANRGIGKLVTGLIKDSPSDRAVEDKRKPGRDD